MKQPYNTALYMRLSRDDENYGDSVSIETQRTILQQYAKDHGLHVVGEYIDDGWSGTNFERPAFQRMMDDVESGKVNCIATKDLSRFGREHVMMDYYLEFVFPEKKVRYIAVAENEDTEKGLSDFVPFKNLFNEFSKGCICPPEIPICVCGRKPRGKLVTRKPIVPSDSEIKENARSRSAKLRVIEKI